MNKQRRNSIKNAVDKLILAKELIEDIKSEEENAFENMPENLQCSMRGEESEEAIDTLEEVVDQLNEIIDNLDDIC